MNNILHFVGRYLNSLDMAAPGDSTAMAETGSYRFQGQLGQTTTLRKDQALQLSDTSVGTLYGGTYQLVKMLLTSTASAARGKAAFWSDVANFVVTADVPTQPGGLFAGVFLNAITKGNFGMIQTKGIATVLFDTLTETGVIGDTVFAVAGGVFNNLADATAVNAGNVNDIVGIALTQPVTAEYDQIFLIATRENL